MEVKPEFLNLWNVFLDSNRITKRLGISWWTPTQLLGIQAPHCRTWGSSHVLSRFEWFLSLSNEWRWATWETADFFAVTLPRWVFPKKRRFKQQNPFNLSLGVSQNHPFRYVICVSNEFYICIYINHHHRWQWDPYITSLQAWLISLRLVPQTVGGPRYTMATLSAPMPFERITSMVQKEVSKNPMARTLKSSDQ